MWLEDPDLSHVVSVLLPDGWHECQQGTLRTPDSDGFAFIADYQDGQVFWVSGPASSVLAVRHAAP